MKDNIVRTIGSDINYIIFVYEIEAEVTQINGATFDTCEKLTNIVIPDTVKHLNIALD